MNSEERKQSLCIGILHPIIMRVGEAVGLLGYCDFYTRCCLAEAEFLIRCWSTHVISTGNGNLTMLTEGMCSNSDKLGKITPRGQQTSITDFGIFLPF